jgi:hypothetical protein
MAWHGIGIGVGVGVGVAGYGQPGLLRDSGCEQNFPWHIFFPFSWATRPWMVGWTDSSCEGFTPKWQ